MSNSGWSVKVDDNEVGSATIKNKYLGVLLGLLLVLLIALTSIIWIWIDVGLKLSGRNGFYRRFNLLDPEDNEITFDGESFARRQ